MVICFVTFLILFKCFHVHTLVSGLVFPVVQVKQIKKNKLSKIFFVKSRISGLYEYLPVYIYRKKYSVSI